VNANIASLQGNAVYFDKAFSTRTRTDTAGTGDNISTASTAGWDEFTVAVYNGTTTTEYANLTQALDSIASSGNYTVTVSSDQSMEPYLFGTNISRQITLAAPAGRNVTIDISSNGSLFTVNINLDFTIGNGITLKGRPGNDSALIQVSSGGALVMKETARITGNNSSSSGGAVYVNNGATFIMDGGEISGNTAANHGGGVYVNAGTFEMNGGTIKDNTAVNNGGGVYIIDGISFTMTNGTISNNNANNGGGFYSTNISVFNMSGGKITGNAATTDGGGVYNITGIFNMSGAATEISGNTAARNGGGVFSTNIGAEFIMTGGKIKENEANDGGGVYNNRGIFTMSGAVTEISGNTAKSNGGGVFNTNANAEFTMSGGTISGNMAAYNGGGVYSNNTDAKFIMNGGIISGNWTNSFGGGVYINSGTFTKTGGTINGYNAGASPNVVKDAGNNLIDNRGHAVYVLKPSVRRKETTADVSLDAGAAAGWDYNAP
jgi:hypothetical protein